MATRNQLTPLSFKG